MKIVFGTNPDFLTLLVTILGTTFGHRFGNSFWLFFVALVYKGGLVAAHVFLSLAALKKTNNASLRANTNTTARVSEALARSVV